ncbi:unannotated protein [freshwater metagenome]|uniref:Unannotated protein n=1 Tax=freshwater metagenome TaxID=449393 RepID=A0A6J7K6V1_9ZZZZ
MSTWLAAPTAADGTTEYGEPATPAVPIAPDVVNVTEPMPSPFTSPEEVKSEAPAGVITSPYVFDHDSAVTVSGTFVTVYTPSVYSIGVLSGAPLSTSPEQCVTYVPGLVEDVTRFVNGATVSV